MKFMRYSRIPMTGTFTGGQSCGWVLIRYFFISANKYRFEFSSLSLRVNGSACALYQECCFACEQLFGRVAFFKSRVESQNLGSLELMKVMVSSLSEISLFLLF